MVSTTTSADTPEAVELRARLTDSLVKKGKVTSPAVESAFRAVPRHCFVPCSPLPEAYADDAVYTKWAADGARISAASQPTIVALMLEQLGIEPGNRILEIGAGTGYNAALMGAITGPSGHVTAVDVDEDLVEGARAHLATAGVTGVDILLSDGALGAPAAAPYDRLIATVGAHEVPRAWLDQLRPGGRLVVPVRLRGAVSRSIIFERGDNGWTSTGSEMAVFMPLRGIGDDARRVIDLTGDGQVTDGRARARRFTRSIARQPVRAARRSPSFPFRAKSDIRARSEQSRRESRQRLSSRADPPAVAVLIRCSLS
jgi:protein-L-isoaspartate(D-aspartate) O-methyltransferase